MTTTYDTKNKLWNPSIVTHDELRAAVGGGSITTTGDGLIIFEKELSEAQKLAVQNLTKDKKV